MDLNQLVVRAQRGEADAFEELVRNTTRLVFARCVLETGDPQRAEDLVQETFLTAFRSIRQLKTPDTFRAWLLRIAQNACIDAHRHDARLRRSPPPRIGADALDGDAAPAKDDAVVHGESRERVLAILRSLPDDYRMPLTLRFLGGADF